jgi:hypothetical protein
MGGMNSGPPPKHPADRVRRNKTPGMTQLPAEGYTGEIPEWPLEAASRTEMQRWKWLWRKPQAVLWIKDGMEDIVARYVRNCIALENGSGMTVAQAYLVSEVRQQEDRLGRSPMALMRLRWEIAADEVEEMRDENTRRGSGRPRLRAIDPGLAADG